MLRTINTVFIECWKRAQESEISLTGLSWQVLHACKAYIFSTQNFIGIIKSKHKWKTEIYVTMMYQTRNPV